MPASEINTTMRKRFRGLHRWIASRLPLAARRRYLYLLGHGRLPRLGNPQTFTQKVNWRILNDRRPELAWTCDKLSMKDYAARQAPDLKIPETLWSGDDLSALAGQPFDRNWILKPNHRSGLVRFGRAGEAVDDDILQSTSGWLRDDQSVVLGEWAYSQARRLFLVEADIGDGEFVDDYKFYVFHGKVVLLHVDQNRFTQHTRNFYTPEWEPVRAAYALPYGVPTDAPDNLAEMVSVAETLAIPFDFMRVDLYSVRGAIWFGELTPYPGGGTRRLEPHDVNQWLGSLWTLPSLDGAARRPGRRRPSAGPGTRTTAAAS